VESSQAAAAAAEAAAAAALAAAQAALDRDGIRAAHGAAGEAAARAGDPGAAQRAHGRARDYCATPAQVADTALAAATAAAAAGAWPTVAAHCAKVEAAGRGAGGGGAGPSSSAPAASTGVQLSVLAAAAAGAAAAAFDARKYRAAALRFAGVGAELGDGLAGRPERAWLGSPADVALFGGLAGAAGLEWGEVSTALLASPSFRDHLDARPDVRAALTDLAAGHFGPALAGLRALTAGPASRLDARLAGHAPALYAQARARILCQYARPYASLRLEPAAADLGMSVRCGTFI